MDKHDPVAQTPPPVGLSIGAQAWSPSSVTSPGANPLSSASSGAEIETLFSKVPLKGKAQAEVQTAAKIACNPKFDHGCFSFPYEMTTSGPWFKNDEFPFAFQNYANASKRPKWFKCDEVPSFLYLFRLFYGPASFLPSLLPLLSRSHISLCLKCPSLHSFSPICVCLFLGSWDSTCTPTITTHHNFHIRKSTPRI